MTEVPEELTKPAVPDWPGSRISLHCREFERPDWSLPADRRRAIALDCRAAGERSLCGSRPCSDQPSNPTPGGIARLKADHGKVTSMFSTGKGRLKRARHRATFPLVKRLMPRASDVNRENLPRSESIACDPLDTLRIRICGRWAAAKPLFLPLAHTLETVR